MGLSEYEEQKDLIAWFRAQFPHLANRIRLSLNGIPKGGHNKAAAIRVSMARASGMVDGESDLFFAIPTKHYHGLFIEMKVASGGKWQPGQQEYLAEMNDAGYYATCCHGAEEAKRCIINYLRAHDE